MKNKIYSKLFEFVDPKSWIISSHVNKTLESTFYTEYKLVFKNKDFSWYYYIYPNDTNKYSRNEYSSSYSYQDLVTLNVSGKISISIATFIILFLIFWFGFDIKSSLLYILCLIFSIISSFFMFSIWNWKIYKALRKAQYNINNAEKIKEKEKEKKLNEEIVGIVNAAVAKNPKLARKTKLQKIKKKFF